MDTIFANDVSSLTANKHTTFLEMDRTGDDLMPVSRIIPTDDRDPKQETQNYLIKSSRDEPSNRKFADTD